MKKKLLTILLSIAVILTSTVTMFAEEQYVLGGTTVTVANATSENILDDGSLVLVFNDTTNNGSIKLEGIATTADILLVGGGGAGGTVRSTAHTSHPGGGGGAGELLIREKISLVSDTYTITVGAGGVADGVFNTKSIGQNGKESKITSTNINIVVKGGGGGGGESEGSSGGSGGGGSNEYANGGTASKNNDDGLVNNGGTGLKRFAGGGGGSAEAGEIGQDNSRGGNGGAGTASSITGEEKYYAAGGGGGTTYSGKSGGAGGSGIGGNGGKYNDNDDAAPTKGIDGTGSGGGGGGRYKPGAAGGSGTVIVRIYPSESSTKTTANVLETVEGGFPTSSELGWVNENGRKAYINGNILTVSFNVPLETILQKEENNYKYVNDSGQNCTFVMTSGKLTSIIVSGALVPGYNGEFFPPAPVAQIGDIGYLTLQDAINAVQNKETIILLGDITTDSTFTNMNDRTFTIDLNNHKITTSAVTGFDINSANLTVKNGTVINNNTSGLSGSTMETRTKAFFLEKEGQGSLTLDGVKIESTGYSVNVNNNNNSNGAKNKTVVLKDSDLSSAKWCAVYANSVDGSNELTINNSNIHSSWTNTSMATLQICVKTTIEKTTVTNDYGAAVGCFENTDLLVKGTENSFVGASGAISTNGSKDLVQITIEGGEFKTTGTTKEAGIAFYHPDGSPLTIKGGTFEGATALYVKGGTIDIQDGSFTGTGNYETAQKVKSGAYTTGDAVVIEASGYLAGEAYDPDPNPSVTISGGLFKSINGSPIAYYTFDGNNEAHNGKMVSGGVLNKEIDDAILVEGKSQVANTDSKTSIDYPYMVGENTAEIEVETGKEENAVPEYKDETKNAVAVKLSRINIDLGPEALTVAADGNIVNKSLEEKAKEITGYKVGDDLTITIKTYLDMSVEKANITTAGSKDNTFSVDITPKYVIVAKATGSDEKVVSKSKDLSVTRTVPLKIYLPLGFANYPSDRVWIKHHLKDGSSVVYGGEEGLPIKLEVADMVVEFDNPDGFSVFDVYLKKVEPDPKPSPAPTPKPGYIVPNTGVN